MINDIFALENGGALIGNILQSLSVSDDKAYLVVNNANKVVICENTTFKYVDTIGGVILPRYLLEINAEKGYLSEWGKGGIDGAIQVIDLKTNKIIKTIKTGKGAEKMIRNSNQVWVVNQGGFSSDSTITIIDTNTDAVINTLKASTAPNSLVQDNAGDTWVLCGGAWGAASGKLIRYKNNTQNGSFDVPQGSNSLVINNEKNTLYFVGNKKVYQKDLTNNQAMVFIDQPSSNVTFGALNGLGYDPKTNNLYVADAKNFSSTGKVYLFDQSKNLVDSLPSGIIPGSFYFHN